MSTKELTEFYLSKDEPHQSCLIALRDLILGHHDDFFETRKYGMPCFCIGKKAVVYLWTDKKTAEPYILVVEGRNINHPSLEQGDRSRMKILRVDSGKDIPVKLVNEILKLAIAATNLD